MLADVFKKFRNRCLENHGLYPSHHLRAPALSWDAMLSATKVELDLISDVDMYSFFEKRLRGGVSYNSKRYSKANNKYLTYYDPKKPTKYITYVVKNNLYAFAISKHLPMGGFKWLDPAKCNLDKYDNDSLRGCLLEVDLEYPKGLQKLYNSIL